MSFVLFVLAFFVSIGLTLSGILFYLFSVTRDSLISTKKYKLFGYNIDLVITRGKQLDIRIKKV